MSDLYFDFVGSFLDGALNLKEKKLLISVKSLRACVCVSV